MRSITALCRSLDTADDLFVSSIRSQHGLKPRPLDQGWNCGEGDPPLADPEGLDLATLKLSIIPARSLDLRCGLRFAKGEMPRIGSVVRRGPSAALRHLPQPHGRRLRAQKTLTRVTISPSPERAPPWLSFLRGVDPPEDHPQIAKMRQSVLNSPAPSWDRRPNGVAGSGWWLGGVI